MEGNKKFSQLYARSKLTKNPQYSNPEQQVGIALLEIVSHFEGDNKYLGSFIEINRVI